MNDQEFSKLELRLQIAPGQGRWPGPEYLHWQKIHAAANEARERAAAMPQISLNDSRWVSDWGKVTA
jgi:hypothetical protein